MEGQLAARDAEVRMSCAGWQGGCAVAGVVCKQKLMVGCRQGRAGM
jgi:hypothetical protein